MEQLKNSVSDSIQIIEKEIKKIKRKKSDLSGSRSGVDFLLSSFGRWEGNANGFLAEFYRRRKQAGRNNK